MFVVFDLDGTLSDPNHRVHFLTSPEKDWDAFYEACDRDAPINPMIETLCAHVDAGHRVEIWTGRRESTRITTSCWLTAYGVPLGVPLHMRPDGDHRPDTDVKGEFLSKSRRIPDLIYEDRKMMVELWRSKGILCAQVAEGDF